MKKLLVLLAIMLTGAVAYAQQEEVHGYVKVHGGGWYHKDDHTRTMCLYGSSGDYGEPQLCFLDRIPAELKGYDFTYSAIWGYEGKPLNVDDVEWI